MAKRRDKLINAPIKVGSVDSESATNGQVLTADGSGNSTWTTVSGSGDTVNATDETITGEWTFSSGLQAQGVVHDGGQVGQVTFVDVSGGYGRVGSYSWDAGAYQPMVIEGSLLRVMARTSDIEMYAGGTLCGHWDTSLSRFDIFGYNTRIRDGASLYLFDASDTKNAQMWHDGTDFKIATSSGKLTLATAGQVEVTGGVNFSMRDAGTIHVFDAADTNSLRIYHDGTDANVSVGNGASTDLNVAGFSGYLDLNGGTGLRIRDTGNTDWVQFDHDGTDFVQAFTNTTRWEIDGATSMDLGGGMDVRLLEAGQLYVYDGVNTNHLRVNHDGTDVNWITSGTTDVNLTSMTGNFWIRDGGGLKISDSTDADFVVMSHDGTDFSAAFTNTASAKFTGAGNSYTFDNLISLGSSVAASSTDLTRHLALYSNSYGINITGSRMNFVVNSADAFHYHSTNGMTVNGDLTCDGFVVNDPAPLIQIQETDATTGEKNWDITSVAGQLRFRAVNDAISGWTNFLTVDRTATDVTSVNVVAADLDVDGAITADTIDAQNKNTSTINNKTADYTLALTDEGETIRFTSGTSTLTIDANTTVPMPVGTLIGVVNDSGNNLSIAITGDTLEWTKNNTSGPRTLADGGGAVLQKVDTTLWKISGSALLT